jgi:membrane-associated protease RseP (regulator of RpoE activity)
MIDLYTLSIIMFFLVLGALIFVDRKRIEFKYILIIRRTKKFRDIIDRIARISPTAWKIIGTIGVLVALYYMIQGMYLLFMITYQVSIGAVKQPALQFILPTPQATGSSGPGYILIPFWFWIITIAAILVPHELSHGIIARAEKIKLKSVGLMIFAIFPGAFVEPDDRELKKKSLITKLRVFSAGSFANFLTSFSIILLISYVIWPLATQPGIQLVSVNDTSPAALAGLKPGMILTEVNGTQIKTTYQEYGSGSGYLAEEIGEVKPGDVLTIKADGSYYNIKLGENKQTNSTYMGITYSPIFNVDSSFFLGWLIPLLTLISLFSLAVGVVNILPLYPLDGGLIAEALAEKVFKKNYKMVVRGLAYMILLIFAYSFVGPLL